MTEWRSHLKALSWAAVVWAWIAALIGVVVASVYFFGPLGGLSLLVMLLFFITYRSALRFIRE
jgi:TctA family transporter